MKPLAFEPANPGNGGSNVPSSVTLLVSLFLILLTFFIIMNNSAEKNYEKKEAALKSMNSKFGKPSDDKINFGGMVKPKIEDYALHLENLLGEAAKIESNLSGSKTIIYLKKGDFYFADEPNIKPTQADNIKSAAKIVSDWNKQQTIRVSIIIGLDKYAVDKKRLHSLEKVFNNSGIYKTVIGLNSDKPDMFNIVVDYD